MKHIVVEKRIAGIIRWLERLNKSYSTGEMASALMEAECAKADLETLRRDVWAKVSPEEIAPKRSIVMAFLRPAFLAAIIVMVMVFPVAKDIPVNITAQEAAEPEVMAVPVVVAEQKPEVAVKPESQPKKIVQAKKTTFSKKLDQLKKEAATMTASPAPQKASPAKTVAYDKVFSLMQTGQRALKNNNSVIKVQ